MRNEANFVQDCAVWAGFGCGPRMNSDNRGLWRCWGWWGKKPVWAGLGSFGGGLREGPRMNSDRGGLWRSWGDAERSQFVQNCAVLGGFWVWATDELG